MADRNDKFTERARLVLTLAQEEAQRFHHNYLGTEHLLLGLIREREGVAAQILTNLGVDLNKVRAAVEFIIGHGGMPPSGEMGLTDRAKKVIELAIEEARHLNHSYIGTEHLLLGLVREGEGIAFGVLDSLGVSLERVRSEIARTLSESGAPDRRPQIDLAEITAAVAALRWATEAVEALEDLNLTTDLSRVLLLNVLRQVGDDLRLLARTLDLSLRDQIRRDLLLVEDAARVFEHHNIESVASPLAQAATSLQAIVR